MENYNVRLIERQRKCSIIINKTRQMWQQDKQIKEIIVIFKHFAPFTNCISVINNTQIDDVKGIDVVMSTYTLIE